MFSGIPQEGPREGFSIKGMIFGFLSHKHLPNGIIGMGGTVLKSIPGDARLLLT